MRSTACVRARDTPVVVVGLTRRLDDDMTYIPTYSTCITSVYTHQPRGGETFKTRILRIWENHCLVGVQTEPWCFVVLHAACLALRNVGCFFFITFTFSLFSLSLPSFHRLLPGWLAYWRLSCLQCTPSPPAVIRGAVMGLVRGE